MKAAKIPAPEPAKNASQVAAVQANSRGRWLGSECYEARWKDRAVDTAAKSKLGIFDHLQQAQGHRNEAAPDSLSCEELQQASDNIKSL